MGSFDLTKPHYDVQFLNGFAAESQKDLVTFGEESYGNRLLLAARDISKRLPRVRFVMIAGPTASGKTTTAFRLREELRRIGVGAAVISLDDFFFGKDAPTKFSDGRSDFESIFSLDVETIHHCVIELMQKGEADFPIFDFQRHERAKEPRHVVVTSHDVVIVEGLHALNPVILPPMDSSQFFRIFVSVKSRFTSEDKVLISPENMRLIRRMVRDNHHRNTPPEKTLLNWADICYASQMYIAPFERTADVVFDTTIPYEPGLFRSELLPLLEGSTHEKAVKMKHALEAFAPLSPSLVPENSLLQEFIGR